TECEAGVDGGWDGCETGVKSPGRGADGGVGGCSGEVCGDIRGLVGGAVASAPGGRRRTCGPSRRALVRGPRGVVCWTTSGGFGLGWGVSVGNPFEDLDVTVTIEDQRGP